MDGHNFSPGQAGGYSLPPPAGAAVGAPHQGHYPPHGGTGSTAPPAPGFVNPGPQFERAALQTGPHQGVQGSVQGKTYNGIDMMISIYTIYTMNDRIIYSNLTIMESHRW